MSTRPPHKIGNVRWDKFKESSSGGFTTVKCRAVSFACPSSYKRQISKLKRHILEIRLPISILQSLHNWTCVIVINIWKPPCNAELAHVVDNHIMESMFGNGGAHPKHSEYRLFMNRVWRAIPSNADWLSKIYVSCAYIVVLNIGDIYV